MSSYPIYLHGLRDRLCIVVGGGHVAERKIQSLLETQAMVRVISPALTDTLRILVDRGDIQHVPRAYREGDLDGAFLAFAATDDPAINRAVGRDAQARRVLVDVVDDPALCSFTVPAVVRRGSLTLSVSTGGQSPALAAHIRRQLQDTFGPEYAALTDILGELRDSVAEACPSAHRQQLWYSLIDSDLLELLRNGQVQQARDKARKIVQDYMVSLYEGQD